MSGKRPSGVRPLNPMKLTMSAITAINKGDQKCHGLSHRSEMAQTEHIMLVTQITPSAATVSLITAFCPLMLGEALDRA